MSKYIKLDDAIDARCPVEDIWEDCINCPLNNSAVEPCKMGKWLNSLPTIEVSEDCISREWVLKAIDAEDVGTPDEMWRPAREYVEMIKNAPSIVPQVPIEDNKAYTYCSRCGMRVVMDAPSILTGIKRGVE